MKDLFAGILQTVFRMAPHPTHAGMEIIGNPRRRSPVLVTTNCAVTIRHVKNATFWLLRQGVSMSGAVQSVDNSQ